MFLHIFKENFIALMYLYAENFDTLEIILKFYFSRALWGVTTLYLYGWRFSRFLTFGVFFWRLRVYVSCEIGAVHLIIYRQCPKVSKFSKFLYSVLYVIQDICILSPTKATDHWLSLLLLVVFARIPIEKNLWIAFKQRIFELYNMLQIVVVHNSIFYNFLTQTRGFISFPPSF